VRAWQTGPRPAVAVGTRRLVTSGEGYGDSTSEYKLGKQEFIRTVILRGLAVA
jgi:hypothetical protein